MNEQDPQAETSYSNLEEGYGMDTAVEETSIQNTEHIAESTNAHQKLPVKEYLKSCDFIEIASCFVFGVLCMLTQYPGIPLNIRPIPSQVLNGDVVINQVNNEVYAGDTVSNAAVVVIGFVAPLVVQFILAKTPPIGTFGDAHKTVCVYFVATALVALATNTMKNYVGYLRPVFYDVCQPDDDYDECTNEDSLDARKSFPSGHSSLAFSGMTLLTMYLLRKFGVYSSTTFLPQDDGTLVVQFTQPEKYKRALSILCLAPMALACFVGASRIYDNKHFPADVVGGAVLGTVIAWFTNGVWFLAFPTV